MRESIALSQCWASKYSVVSELLLYYIFHFTYQSRYTTIILNLVNQTILDCLQNI